MNKNILTLACLIFISTLVYGANPPEKIIYGIDDAEILMSAWDENIRSWTYIEHRNGKESFPLYKLLPGAPNLSLAVDTASEPKTYNNKFLALQRIELGVLTDETHHSKTTEKAYCDIIEVSTGCVLLTRPAEYCSGSWKNDKWLRDNGDYIEITLETPKPESIIKNIKNLKKTEKTNSIKEYMFMGIESYLACHPPQQSVQPLNDLAFFLAEGGDNYNAMKLYLEVEKSAPSRVVLKLNIADALWIDGKTSEAKKYYSDYKSIMEKTERSKLIPEHVKNRLSQ